MARLTILSSLIIIYFKYPEHTKHTKCVQYYRLNRQTTIVNTGTTHIPPTPNCPKRRLPPLSSLSRLEFNPRLSNLIRHHPTSPRSPIQGDLHIKRSNPSMPSPPHLQWVQCSSSPAQGPILHRGTVGTTASKLTASDSVLA